jgi:hypothetical protein
MNIAPDSGAFSFTSSKLEVIPNPVNADGWMITEDGFPIQFLNANFFMDKEMAESVAQSRRYISAKNNALMMGMSRENFDRKWDSAQKLPEDLI